MMFGKRIDILGLGWLGLPLAERLQAQGWAVTGTCQTAEKAALLQAQGLAARPVAPPFSWTVAEPSDGLATIFFNLPHSLPPADYLQALDFALSPQAKAQRLLLISSTGVYGTQPAGPIFETATAQPDRQSAQLALLAEEKLKAWNKPWLILRLAGLVGGTREPARFLAGRQGLEQAHAPVNLIHLEDCLGLIQTLLEAPLSVWNEVYHAASLGHPTRAEYYLERALAKGYTPPQFLPDAKAKEDYAYVDSAKILKATGYGFVYAEPGDYP
jgi:nucleoside-diphosphate-sugar epimerase